MANLLRFADTTLGRNIAASNTLAVTLVDCPYCGAPSGAPCTITVPCRSADGLPFELQHVLCTIHNARWKAARHSSIGAGR